MDVLGDAVAEPDEIVDVFLTNPVNATIQTVTLPGGGHTLLTDMLITIQNDDGVVPTVSVGDATVVEGNGVGQPNAANLTLSLSQATSVAVTVLVTAGDGTATASDYLGFIRPDGSLGGLTQTVSFAPGETTQTVALAVVGDIAVEPDETVLVSLSNPSNANIADGQGVVTIVNDDIASGVRWINPDSGDWNTASDWSTGTVPGADDNVTIDLPGGANPTVTVSTPAVARSITSTEHLAVVTGGSLTVADTARMANLAISGGMATFNGATTITTLRETSGTITGSGEIALTGSGAAASTWSGGAMSGSGTTVITGELDSASGANDLTLVRPLILGDGIAPASMTLTGTGTLTMNDPDFNPGTLIVRDHSTLNLASDMDLVVTGGIQGGSLVSVDTGGTIVKSGAGTLTDFASLFLTNNGLVDVRSGTLRLFGGGSQTRDGSFNVASGATLDLNVGFTHQFTGNGGITGIGTVLLDGGFISKSGIGTTTTITPTVINFGGVGTRSGTLVFSGTVTNNNQMIVDAGATMTVSGTLTNYDGATQTLTAGGSNGAVFVVQGTMRIANADIAVNAAGITLDGPASQLLNDTTGADALAGFMREASTGGFFHLANGRNFTTGGEFTNEGYLWISPGSTLTVLTRFTNVGGNLLIEIGGRAPSEFGRLVVTGVPAEAAIDFGSLNINFVNDFVPAVGDRFQFMTFASRTGYFFATHLPSGTLVDQGAPTDLELVFDPEAAGLHWINPAGGDWNDASNWATGTVPGPNDDVFIDAPGAYTVTLSSGDTIVNSIVTDHPIDLTGGTLTVNGTLQLTDTILTLNGGTLSDAIVEARSVGGTAPFIGVLVPAGGNGTLDGVRLNSFDGLATSQVLVEAGATLTVRNGLSALDTAPSLLSVAGTVSVEDAQAVDLAVQITGGAMLAAAPGGTLTLGSLAAVSGTGTLGSSTTQILNQGVILGPQTADGVLTLFNLTNTGLLSSGPDGLTLVVSGFLINQGTLELRSTGGIQVTGDFTNSSVGQIQVKFFRSFDVGLLQITGTATLDGTLTVLNAVSGDPTEPVRDQFMIFASRSGFFATTTFNDIDPLFTAAVDQSDPIALELVIA